MLTGFFALSVTFAEDNTEIKPMADPVFSTFWRIASSHSSPSEYGSWREGPTGRGPGILSLTNQSSYNRSVSVSVSGEYPVGVGAINANLGVKIGSSSTYGTNYSISIDSGQRKTILYRPKFRVTKVKQVKVRINNYTDETVVLDTKYAYVSKFIDWDYSWKAGY